MNPALGETYRDGHRRVDDHVRALVAAGRDPAGIAVPGCPGWSVHGVVSHLAAIPVDALAGRLRGIPDDAFTAGQVAERADRTVESVLDEWASHVDAFAAVIDEVGMVPPVADVLTHEGDIREALGDPVPPEAAWRETARRMCRGIVAGVDAPGTLTVRSAGDTWSGGSGDPGPVASVDVEPWELFRGLMGRRSSAQMRAWAWDGDAGPWVDRLPVFGPRRDDQPVPRT